MKSHRVLTGVVVVAGAVATLGFFTVDRTAAGPAAAQKSMTKEDLVARGKYLISFGGCHDCHTPKLMTDKGPMPDMARELSGHPEGKKIPQFSKESVAPGMWVMCSEDFTAWVGPWGISYAANLTPEQNTGTGLWTEEMFIGAMRNGKHMGAGRPILPPMPYFNVAGLSDDDLRAVFAYLKSIKPIKNAVPAAMTLDEHFSMNK